MWLNSALLVLPGFFFWGLSSVVISCSLDCVLGVLCKKLHSTKCQTPQMRTPAEGLHGSFLAHVLKFPFEKLTVWELEVVLPRSHTAMELGFCCYVCTVQAAIPK